MSNSSEAGMGFEKKGYMTRSLRSPDGRVLSFDCGRCGYEVCFGDEGAPRMGQLADEKERRCA